VLYLRNNRRKKSLFFYAAQSFSIPDP